MPETWITVTVGDLATEVRYGSSAKTSSDPRGVPVLRMGNLVEGKLDLGNLKYLPSDHGEFPDLFLEPGDVLFNRTNSAELVGKTAVYRGIPSPCSFASYLIRVRLEGAMSEWLSYYLNSPFGRSQINAVVSQQVGQANVNGTKLRAFQFTLPPLAEQRRIVAKIEELFSELDAGEESLRRARRQLGVYRQSLLKQAFEGKLTEQWRKQNPHLLESPDQLLKRIQAERQARYKEQLEAWPAAVKKWEKYGRKGKKPSSPREPKFVPPIDKEIESQLPGLPNSWCWGTTEHTCDVVRGGSPRPAGSPTFYDGDIPFLKVADLTRVEGPYVDSFTSTIKEAGLQKTRYIEPPVLMISNSGATLGVPRICRIAATFNDGIAAFFDLSPETHAYYYYFWTSKTEALRNIDQGAAQPNLNTDLLKTYPIPLCSLPEQQEIVRLLDEQFTVIEQNEREIDAALKRSAALRQSILKKAFTGQLVPQDPADEPASALLERIRMERTGLTKPGRKATSQASGPSVQSVVRKSS